MVDLAALPDRLLAPLLDAAGAAVQARTPDEVPTAARSLVGFDRRGLARGPARRQLREALDADADFRRALFETFAAREDVRALVDGWTLAGALAIASSAAQRHELALLTSALVAAEPEGVDVGIGISLALDAQASESRADDTRTAERAREREREAQRRLTAARDELARERDELVEQLRAARRERRESRQDAALVEERDGLRARVDAIEGELHDVRAQLERAEGARARANVRAKRAETQHGESLDRVRALERANGELRREVEQPRPPPPTPERVVEVPARGQAARRRRGGRVQPALPGGLFADSIEGADAMLRDAAVVLVVDGYNVTKAAAAGGSLATEREWLVRALEALHLRCGPEIVVVFDGDDTPVFGQRKRRGVRVAFSPAADEADSVVVEAVAATPPTVPVVVASSDGWVREHAETFGAVVIAAPTLLGVLRRAG